MRKNNLERMIQLAESVFHAKNDLAQISVTQEDMQKLRAIHPRSMTEAADSQGPFAWILLIPTTRGLMEKFIAKEIGERDLVDRTPLDIQYDALYLCSALVLPEHRGKGLAKRLMLDAIASIREQHPIRSLFYWAFSEEGEKLAHSVARGCGLPLSRRESE